LSKELDIIDLLKSVHHTKIALKSILSRKQQLLINFQRNLVIETSESDDSSDEDIEKYFHQHISSKDPMDRLFILAKANALL
jgi:hypothetical protein